MTTLNHTYDLIRQAEQKCRNGSLNEASEIFKQALDTLDTDTLNPSNIDGAVLEAVQLLRDDLTLRIKELQICIKETPKEEKTIESRKNSASVIHSALTNNNLAASRYWDGSRNNLEGSMNVLTDPVMNSFFNKLQNSMLEIISDAKSEGSNVNELNSTAVFRIDQFKKEMLIYEQRKMREHHMKLEQYAQENKRLVIRNAKLKERWDNLVESALQRKNRQQEP
ncbi:hypothetical protein RNJ44_01527 [Nakaseomyces bracarensis]|uniref:Uncharacterized protein n=1 Tax=Nakaseomyces bracarensis TaxID=273131 RepID=A0ABR4NPZ8_9SACH